MSTAPKMSKQSPRQDGMVLITGLIFMVVLTLIVVASMRTTLLEERMAGNARDTDLAFQAAEAALRAGEEVLKEVLNSASLEEFTSTSPAYLSVDTRMDTYWRDTHDWSADAEAVTGTITGVSAAPRFVIEELRPIPAAGNESETFKPLLDSSIFKVTARGVGGNPSTVVVLQSTYPRR